MKIFFNEALAEVTENTTAYQFRDWVDKNYDVVVLNGFPLSQDKILSEGDRITLIQKGKVPSKDELEALLIARHTPNIHKKLKNGKVAILGLGGLGSNIAVSLARVGVGELVLVDYDVVEPSNLNRQQYFVEHIGMKKTEALKNILEKINPFVNIKTKDVFVTKENIEFLKECDIIIEAFDDAKCKAMVCNAALKNFRDKYLIASSGMAGYYDSNDIRTKKIRDKFYICGDFEHEAKEGDGLMAPRVAICANHMANLAMKILIDEIK
ncbi:MAG: sulfur carrier protein ThiS adenylyltransferase ThiF [Intestinibacter sp.]|uniref:sulfur carrier protein ThiS adenylyltransferase ThiF n=1 Tax=Intestinibacter sp. TaxID=1965304 RepID=UPI002A840367|nr:sulfur carrier protein ThiS adenylyltransferase ThiF [Intestinibacter sp.]MDY4574100.1 sulfur carrier protein ThiS adenylyltransferase ThiF [Intestinibacter sp.]